MTALAAVIALSSTPLFAQTADSPAAPDAPVIAAPPAPEISAPAVSLATPAPEVAPVAAAPIEPVAAMRTQSTPVVHTGDDDVASSTPVRTRSVAAAPTRIATVSTKTVTTAPAIAPVAAAPLLATPAPAPLPVESAAIEPAAPPAPAQVVTTRTTNVDETAEIGALAAVGLLAAGGLAYGLSRRRRREDEIVEETVYEPETVYDAAPAAPLAARAVPLAAVPAVAGASHLHKDFDLSRFGPHTQAAYLGRTPENPSYSLRRRLSRASFYDTRAREAAEAGIAPSIPTPMAASAAARNDDQIVVRVGKQGPSRLFGLGRPSLANQR